MDKGVHWQGPGFVWIKVYIGRGPGFMWVKVYIGRVLDLCG